MAEVPAAAAAATAAEAPAAATAAEAPAVAATAVVPAAATAAEAPVAVATAAEAPAEATNPPLQGPLESPHLRDQDTNKTRVIKTIIEELAPDGRVLSSMVESETKKHYY